MIIRGPFTVKWGENTLEDIESIDFDLVTNTEDYEDNNGIVFAIEKSKRFSAKITLLASDIASLAAVLPQYFIPSGGSLTDGTLVDSSSGAIDIPVPGCSSPFIYNDLIINSCSSNGEKINIKHARTVIDDIEIGKIRKIVVNFIGEPISGSSFLQISAEPDPEEFLLLDSGEPFLLDDGDNLTL